MPAAAADLTTVTQVQNLIQVDAADVTSGLLQTLVTSVSRYIVQFCSRTNMNAVATVTDLLDGSGSDKQFVQEWPIKTITSVAVFGVAVPASPDNVQPGYIFDANAIMLLPNTNVGAPLSRYNWSSGKFPRGRKNVQVVYQAGYDSASNPPGNVAYNGAPDDLGYAVTYLVAQEYKRRGWIDQKTKTVSAAGEVVTFRDWEWPPFIEGIIQEYKQPWPLG